MAWPDDQRELTRERILESAARLFAQKGFEQVGIDDLMAGAGLTRGAFYSYFRTKAELYSEAIQYAAKTGGKYLRDLGQKGLGELIDGYLQRSHTTGESMMCPLAFLSADVTRREPEVRKVYSTAFKSFVALLSEVSPSTDRNQILQIAVAMIGGVSLARAVDEPLLCEEILAACRSDCYELLAGR